MTRPNAAAKNSFLRPLLQRGFSSSSSLTECQSPPHISITILPNPAGTGKQTHFPYEEETQSPTSCLSSSLPPSDPYLILNPARTPSSPSVRQSRSSRHITILSEPAREKQRAMEWGSTQSMQNVSAAGMRVPTIKPKSILKAPVPAPQPPALATDVKPSKSAIVAKARNLVVKVQLPKIVIHGPESYEARAETGVYHRAGTVTGTTNYGEMLGVLDVDSRSGLRQNDLARWYYPKKLAAEKIVRRLGSMVRKGSRIVAVRRRKPSRRYI
jgi:hypothetical protein